MHCLDNGSSESSSVARCLAQMKQLEHDVVVGACQQSAMQRHLNSALSCKEHHEGSLYIEETEEKNHISTVSKGKDDEALTFCRKDRHAVVRSWTEIENFSET